MSKHIFILLAYLFHQYIYVSICFFTRHISFSDMDFSKINVFQNFYSLYSLFSHVNISFVL